MDPRDAPLQQHPSEPTSAPTSAPLSAPDLARHMSANSPAGAFDEMRGCVASDAAATSALSGPWSDFMSHIGTEGFADLDQRSDTLARQLRDNGVSYNVYADANGPQRPWALDLFPLLITPQSWQHIESGVLQRVQLLQHILQDVYGPQTLLQAGLLPPALVQGNPGYLRPMHGVTPVGGNHVQIASFDLSRGPDGLWWLVSQRLQAPSGLGYLLENRLGISRQFPQAFEAMKIQRLAGTYQAWIEGLKKMSPAGEQANVALLTPGPYNETYFEHVYLARYLGISLVQGSDLTVRDQRLYLKTLHGLDPVHVLIKRVDDAWLDPLELKPESTLGVPGLLQAVRAGHVLMANPPGTGFLESPAVMGFLPAIAHSVFGQELQLPALPTWWCGERTAMQEAWARVNECVIKPTYPASPLHAHFEAQMGHRLDQRAKDEWGGRLLGRGGDHTLQSQWPLSRLPTWRVRSAAPQIVPRPMLLRVFALADGSGSWRVLPGGLTRLAHDDDGITTMQNGGSSADTWVMTSGNVDTTSLIPPQQLRLGSWTQAKAVITSRAASNLFWMGRYTERAENSLRLVQLSLETLNGGDQSCEPLLACLSDLAFQQSLLPPGTPTAVQAKRVFERSLIASLCDVQHTSSLGQSLRALKLTAAAVRERLSPEQWHITERAEAEFFARAGEYTLGNDYSSAQALRVLDATSAYLAAITGAQTDRMTRDNGWRLLSVGRQVERLGFLASALALGFEKQAVQQTAGFDGMLALFDSAITFRAQYQQHREMGPLLELLVTNRDNPRSLAWVTQTLRGRLSKLGGCGANEQDELAMRLSNPDHWSLNDWCDGHSVTPALIDFLRACAHAAWKLSDEVSLHYFTHSDESGLILGA